jgi:hypothetical protein
MILWRWSRMLWLHNEDLLSPSFEKEIDGLAH